MNILYIMSSFNIYGGTPKKTLDLLKHFKGRGSMYAYSSAYCEFKPLFEETGAYIRDGAYGRNVFRHLRQLLRIVDERAIDFVQTQFGMGELLGLFLKIFRPKLILAVAFVGPFEPHGLKKCFASLIYKKVDAFVYISQYVKREKLKQFPLLKKKASRVILNGTEKRQTTSDKLPEMISPALLNVASLLDWKNADVLIDAMAIIAMKNPNTMVTLYIAGEGPEGERLSAKIKGLCLEDRVFLVGNQKNVGGMLERCDIYVHPAYAEGFGIAVAEAMMARKPVVVANAGALPELIAENVSGLLVDPFDANAWAAAVLKLLDDKQLRETMAGNAENTAVALFGVEKYVENYEAFYRELLEAVHGPV